MSPRLEKAALWTGRIVSTLLIALFLLDAGMKLIMIPEVVEGSQKMGWPADALTTRTLGAVLVLATLLYAWPRTATLGAIVLTGYLGGAVAIHVRVADPLFTHTLFAVYLGIALWGALWLRDPRIRALIPLRQ